MELIVANGAGYSDPWNTSAEGVEFIALNHLRNPVEILNAAISASSTEIVHILYPGTEATEHWTDSVDRWFEAPETAAVIPCVYDRRKSNRVFSLGVRYLSGGIIRTLRRSQWSRDDQNTIAPHISAVFVRKSRLEQIGLLDSSFLPQISYVDMALSLTASGSRLVVDQDCRITVRPNLLPGTAPFTWGIQTERLYYRWLHQNRSLVDLGEHLTSFFFDFGRHFPRMKAFQLLLGRSIGLFFFGEKIRPAVLSGPAPTVTETESVPFDSSKWNERKTA